jgi:putative transport protein
MIWKLYAVSAALSWSKRASVAEDLALVLPILTLGLLFFRMPFDKVAGIFADACGNPAILAYSNKLTPTDRADCAMIF